MKFTETKIPKFRRFVIQNFPFIEQDFDALTDYQLISKVVEYLNKCIDSVNADSVQIEQLTNAYNELKSYVDNYFDNLDVQDEINNKLDAMVEDGTLQEIIGDYLNANAFWGFDSVADMKSSTNLIDGSFARTLGYYGKNDKGGAIYKIREITNSDVVNEMNIIAVGDNDLIAELIVGDEINLKQLGAKTDGTSCHTQLQFAVNNYHTVYIPAGEYHLSQPITLAQSYVEVKGENYNVSKIVYDVEESNETSIITLNNTSQHCRFSDFSLIGPYAYPETTSATSTFNVNGFDLNASSYNEFYRVQCYKLKYCIKVHRAWCLLFDNCLLRRSNMGIYCNPSNSEFNNERIVSCKFQYCITGISLAGGWNQVIESCDFENNDEGLYRTNEGDIQIIGNYFEDYLRIAYGNNPIDNALILGNRFFAGSSSLDRMPFCRYHGNADKTKITIQNNDFKVADDASATNPCVAQYGSSGIITSETVKATLIENNTVNSTLFTTDNFKGICIWYGKVYTYALDHSTYINIGNTPTYQLDANETRFRIGGGSGHTGTINVPNVLNYDETKNPRDYYFCFGSNIQEGATDTVTFAAPSANQDIWGPATLTLGDYIGKLVQLRYLGKISNKATWQVLV